MATFKKKCVDKAGGLCVLVFLPHILDDSRVVAMSGWRFLLTRRRLYLASQSVCFGLKVASSPLLRRSLAFRLGFLLLRRLVVARSGSVSCARRFLRMVFLSL